jgi:hypothetical protein
MKRCELHSFLASELDLMNHKFRVPTTLLSGENSGRHSTGDCKYAKVDLELVRRESSLVPTRNETPISHLVTICSTS